MFTMKKTNTKSLTCQPRRKVDMGVSKKSVSWTSKFVMIVLQDHGRRSDITFLVQTFWTLPYALASFVFRRGTKDNNAFKCDRGTESGRMMQLLSALEP